MADVSSTGQSVPVRLVDSSESLVATIQAGGDGNNYLFNKTQIIGTTPASNVMTFSQKCLNGASDDLTVNGSIANVTFSASAASGQTWNVTGIFLMFSDKGTNTPVSFGGQPALTNGILVNAVVSGTTYTLTTIKNNQDILNTTPVNAVYTLSGTVFVYMTAIRPGVPIVLSGNNSDKISIVIRDDVTKIVNATSCIQYYRTIP